MEISNKLSEQILSVVPQLETKFGIKIGYSHPMGCFLNDEDDFIIYQTGEYNELSENFDYGPVYIIESNQYEQEHNGFLTSIKTDLHQKNEKIIDFLIDVVKWIKGGELKVYESQTFENWIWKPLGDGRFDISRKASYGETSYCAFLGEFEKEDKKLEEHIANLYM